MRLRPLRLNGTLRSAAHIGNDYKVLNGIGQYPWELTGGTTPLRPEQHGQASARSCGSAPGTGRAGFTAPARRSARRSG